MPTIAGPIRHWSRKLKSSVTTKASARKSDIRQKSEADTDLTEISASPVLVRRGSCEKIWNEPRTAPMPAWATPKRMGSYGASHPETQGLSSTETNGSISIQEDTNRLSRQKSFI